MKGLITSIITVLALSGAQAHAETQDKAPKLVIGITIDQLRTDYLESFSPLYGEKGFKRLWRDGKVYNNIQYSFDNVDRSSAVAAIYTGAPPALNGIIGNRWLDITTLRPISCVDDANYMGNYTDETSSPNQLLTSTLADELKIATRNRGLIYAISPFRDAAILAAGHSGNGAFWINQNTGKWCGSTYYTDFPWWLNQYNDNSSIDFRISNLVWTPYHSFDKYGYLPEWRDGAFKYKFEDERTNKFRRIVTSPYANDEVNALVRELFEKSELGRDDVTDMLSLNYYAGNYMNKTVQEAATEIQDAYVRLDLALANLFEMVDKKIGLDNVLFFITSTGYVDSESSDLGIYRIPSGEFHLNRCAALLNMYLMAIYGEGKYVESYYDQQIYLNHKLIEQKNLVLSDIQNKSADFLMQFSGVNTAYSAQQLLSGAWSPEIEKIRNGYHRKRSGDLYVSVLPGWTVVNENNSSFNKVVRDGYIPMPLIFFGGSLKGEHIDTPISVDRIAPTIARFMRIRAPNGSKAPPITLKR